MGEFQIKFGDQELGTITATDDNSNGTLGTDEVGTPTWSAALELIPNAEQAKAEAKVIINGKEVPLSQFRSGQYKYDKSNPKLAKLFGAKPPKPTAPEPAAPEPADPQPAASESGSEATNDQNFRTLIEAPGGKQWIEGTHDGKNTKDRILEEIKKDKDLVQRIKESDKPEQLGMFE